MASNPADEPRGPGRRRETRFPYRATLALEAEAGEAIEAEADRYGLSVAAVIRAAFHRGWPLEVKARRNRDSK